MPMDRRQFLGTLAGAAAGAAFGPLARAAEAPKPKRPPNLVVIFTDDLGYGDVGCYGATDLSTPRIDRMAAEGMRFTDYYTAAPVCTPARAAILTGCYADRVGLNLVLYAEDRQTLSTGEVTLADICKAQDYATAIVGKWHLGGIPPTRHGFDEWIGTTDSEKPRTKVCTEATVDFMRRHRDRPFFVYLAHADPHVPLKAFPPFEGRSKRGLYGDVVETLDWSTGQILDELAALGLDEDTLVLFTSDNGPWLQQGPEGGSSGPLQGGKFSAFEGGHRVPGIMRWPGRIPAGGVCHEIATTLDLLPTFAPLCGGSAPTDRVIDGQDIWPLMAGTPGAVTPHKPFFYSEGANPTHIRAVRSGKWKLFGWPEAKTARPDWYPAALYDLERDIGEKTNVVADHPDVEKRLKGLLEAFKADLKEHSRPVGLRPE